jgi:hypothetical protein
MNEVAGPVYGRIAGKGLADEFAGTYYAIVEGLDGGGYRVALARSDAEQLRVGDLVAMQTQPMGGPEREVERHRLTIRRGALEIQDEEIRRPAPLQLDDLGDRPLAPYGLGSAVRRAQAIRRDYLRGLGIEPDGPERAAKLRELERQTLGQELAQKSGREFLPVTPVVFEGRVEHAGRGADGRAYALVGDDRRFVVVEARPELAQHIGRRVMLETGRDGTMQVGALGLDRDR